MHRKLKKITSSSSKLRNNWLLKPISHFLTDPKLWHFNKRTVASGVAIGVLVGFLPAPFQMLLAAIIAIIARVNVPVSIALTWISNPISMPFIFTANYYLGCWVLRIDSNLPKLSFSIDSMLNLGGEVLKPLYLGSVLMGAAFSAICFIGIRVWWRFNVLQRHRERRVNKLKCHKK